ncbi:hypothetical protein Zmor_006662 [Zophobas morio]|uniref:Uncharacterized protein n=1 Tax=Zophobas morio TaxID=2755281 RepID=A0AA38IXX4_9CUCU|nr:hypothetical protein Zmor_006662 [Zophobas morio]
MRTRRVLCNRVACLWLPVMELKKNVPRRVEIELTTPSFAGRELCHLSYRSVIIFPYFYVDIAPPQPVYLGLGLGLKCPSVAAVAQQET